MFYSSHPNIFHFAEKLKTIQANNYLKIRASMNEIPMEKQQKQNFVNMREIQNDLKTKTFLKFTKQLASFCRPSS
jgi:hypothetical protein